MWVAKFCVLFSLVYLWSVGKVDTSEDDGVSQTKWVDHTTRWWNTYFSSKYYHCGVALKTRPIKSLRAPLEKGWLGNPTTFVEDCRFCLTAGWGGDSIYILRGTPLRYCPWKGMFPRDSDKFMGFHYVCKPEDCDNPFIPIALSWRDVRCDIDNLLERTMSDYLSNRCQSNIANDLKRKIDLVDATKGPIYDKEWLTDGDYGAVRFLNWITSGVWRTKSPPEQKTETERELEIEHREDHRQIEREQEEAKNIAFGWQLKVHENAILELGGDLEEEEDTTNATIAGIFLR